MSSSHLYDHHKTCIAEEFGDPNADGKDFGQAKLRSGWQGHGHDLSYNGSISSIICSGEMDNMYRLHCQLDLLDPVHPRRPTYQLNGNALHGARFSPRSLH